jgi:hypothetical protein
MLYMGFSILSGLASSASEGKPARHTAVHHDDRKDLIKFQKLITQVVRRNPAGAGVIEDCSLSEVGSLVVTVGSPWHNASTSARRELTGMLANAWKQIHGSDAVIRIVDRAGNRVGGSSLLGGVEVED